MLTWMCLLQKLLLEDNMSVEQVKRMARWGDMAPRMKALQQETSQKGGLDYKRPSVQKRPQVHPLGELISALSLWFGRLNSPLWLVNYLCRWPPCVEGSASGDLPEGALEYKRPSVQKQLMSIFWVDLSRMLAVLL